MLDWVWGMVEREEREEREVMGGEGRNVVESLGQEPRARKNH